MKALIALENIHTKFEQKSDENPRKSDFHFLEHFLEQGCSQPNYLAGLIEQTMVPTYHRINPRASQQIQQFNK